MAELEKEVRIIPDKDKQQKLKEVVQKKALLQQMKNTIDALLLRLDKMTEINNKEQIPSNNKINNDDGKSSLVNSEGPNKTKEKNNKGIIDNKDKQCQEHFKKVNDMSTLMRMLQNLDKRLAVIEKVIGVDDADKRGGLNLVEMLIELKEEVHNLSKQLIPHKKDTKKEEMERLKKLDRIAIIFDEKVWDNLPREVLYV